MPELPDLEVYAASLRRRVVGTALRGIRLKSPFLLRSVEVAPAALAGRDVLAVQRFGKRLLFRLAGDGFMLLHLMIAGRLAWRDIGAPLVGKTLLAAFDFMGGTLLLTEASVQKRAALHLGLGEAQLAAHGRGGLEVLACSEAAFVAALRAGNHTLKRALTDQRIFSGIGNAYSDEILHAARLSPIKLTSRLSDAEASGLFVATRDVLQAWVARLLAETGESFPSQVTAFRPDMAVHGKYGKPCPQCDAKIMRIVYASRECNYCAICQNAGRLLADRALSRLLKQDWPRTLEELELLPQQAGAARLARQKRQRGSSEPGSEG